MNKNNKTIEHMTARQAATKRQQHDSFRQHQLFRRYTNQHNIYDKIARCPLSLVISSIARSATRRYLSYSEADFEVFRPAGATRWTDGGEIGMEEGPSVPSSMPNFTPSVHATLRV